MKRLLLVFGLLIAPSWAFACDTYKSVQGARVVTYSGDYDAGFTLQDNGKTEHYSFWDAGAGTGKIIGVPDGRPDDGAVVKTPKGQFWFGPEKFVEACK